MGLMHDLFDGSDHDLLPDWNRTPLRSQAYLCGLDASVTCAAHGNERWIVRLWHGGDIHYSATDYATREEGEAAAVDMVADIARAFLGVPNTEAKPRCEATSA